MSKRSSDRRRDSTTSAQRLANIDELRLRIAVEAARLISESGVRDYQFAKRKAADRLAVFDDFALPKNSEIEDALREHQRLFQADDHPRTLHRLRESAVQAMNFFAAFEPRLVGAILEGTADRHSAICLHLFSDDPDEPARFLDERGIPFEQATRRLRVSRDEYMEFPALEFAVDAIAINVTIFAHDEQRQAPLDHVDARPMRRASLTVVQGMLRDADGLSA